MTLLQVLALCGEATAVVSFLLACAVSFHKIANGQRCLLRSEMLRIYYHHAPDGEIRQYEYENFVLLYEAYKRLGGNSFIDRIYAEVQTWKMMT